MFIYVKIIMSYLPMSWAVESHFLSNTGMILNNDQ